MKKEINAKMQLILLIAIVSIIYAIQLVVTAVFILEEKEEKQTVADSCIRTEAVVVEAGEVKESTGRGATGWSQQCVIEYQLANGKVRQTSYLADNRKEYGPLESGEKIEVLVSPIYQEVKSVRIESSSHIPMMLFWTALGAVIYGGLIVRSTMEYRKKKHR